jgi:hypothetical protein
MSEGSAAYLLVIGEREALAWILRERRMAFPSTTRREVSQLQVGDQLFLLTTRGCFHNPGRDATRVVGTATVETPVAVLDPAVELVGRTFPRGCNIEIVSLAPYLTGVELLPLIPRLDAFRGASAWGMRLRKPLVPISSKDTRLLTRELGPVATTRLSAAVPTYLDNIRPVPSQARSRAGS